MVEVRTVAAKPIRPARTVFGLNVKSTRKALGLKQADLFMRTGIAVSTISEIENGKQNISLDLMERIAIELDSDLSALLTPPQTMDGA